VLHGGGGDVPANTFFEKELKSNLEYQKLQKKVLEKEVPQNPIGGNWVNLILSHLLNGT
jgi:hypothetical protein